MKAIEKNQRCFESTEAYVHTHIITTQGGDVDDSIDEMIKGRTSPKCSSLSS